jgi:streptogramin lyase
VKSHPSCRAVKLVTCALVVFVAAACAGGGGGSAVATPAPTRGAPYGPQVFNVAIYSPAAGPATSSQFYGIATGSDGNLWFAAGGSGPGSIVKMNTEGQMEAYALPAGIPRTPAWVTLGPDGAIWFTEASTNGGNGIPQLGRIDTQGNITEFALPPNDSPAGIATGSDGNLWYVASVYPTPSSNPVGALRAFSPTTHTIVASVLNAQLLGVQGGPANSIVTNPHDGSLILSGGGPVLRVFPGASPTVTTAFTLPTGLGCGAAALGTDGNMYFQCSSSNTPAVLAQVSEATYAVTLTNEQTSFRSSTTATGVTLGAVLAYGSDGNLYVWGTVAASGLSGPGIIAISKSGLVLGFNYDASSYHTATAAVNGPDHNVWFTTSDNNSGTGIIFKVVPI